MRLTGFLALFAPFGVYWRAGLLVERADEALEQRQEPRPVIDDRVAGYSVILKPAEETPGNALARASAWRRDQFLR